MQRIWLLSLPPAAPQSFREKHSLNASEVKLTPGVQFCRPVCPPHSGGQNPGSWGQGKEPLDLIEVSQQREPKWGGGGWR